MNAPQGYRIEAFEPSKLPPAQLREAALFEQALQHERVPEDPLMDPEVIEVRLRADAPGHWRAFAGARDQGGAIVGYSGVFWQTNERGNHHLRWCEIAVAPAHRRRGVARRLVAWLEDTALTAGTFTIALELRAGNAGARAFYAALGYRELARVPGYYQGRESAIRMMRDVARQPRGDAAPPPAA